MLAPVDTEPDEDTEELAYLPLALVPVDPPLAGHLVRPSRGPLVFVSRWLLTFVLLRNLTGMPTVSFARRSNIFLSKKF